MLNLMLFVSGATLMTVAVLRARRRVVTPTTTPVSGDWRAAHLYSDGKRGFEA